MPSRIPLVPKVALGEEIPQGRKGALERGTRRGRWVEWVKEQGILLDHKAARALVEEIPQDRWADRDKGIPPGSPVGQVKGRKG